MPQVHIHLHRTRDAARFGEAGEPGPKGATNKTAPPGPEPADSIKNAPGYSEAAYNRLKAQGLGDAEIRVRLAKLAPR